MKKYDATKSLRQRFHRPNIVPFANVLLIVLITMYFVSDYGHICVDIPNAEYSDYQPVNVFPEICILRNGDIAFGNRSIEDLTKLPVFIGEELKMYRPPGNKILFKIDRDVPFGKVQEVLTLVKKVNVGTIGLITMEHATLEQLWATPGMQYWWKYESI